MLEVLIHARRYVAHRTHVRLGLHLHVQQAHEERFMVLELSLRPPLERLQSLVILEHTLLHAHHQTRLGVHYAYLTIPQVVTTTQLAHLR